MRDPDVRYVMFTDNKKFVSSTWDMVLVDVKDPRLEARIIKTQPHVYLPYHTYNIWVDASFEPKCKNWELLTDRCVDIQAYKHPTRDCLYDEGKICLKLKIDSAEVIHKQLNMIVEKGYPKHYVLNVTGFLEGKKKEKVREY